jgi:sugar phosphate isomerase/epimerase
MSEQKPLQIAVQMYSLRAIDGFDAQLALARRCGFDWIEAVGTHGLAPAQFARQVKAAGAQVGSMHVGLADLERDPLPLIEACGLTGCPLIVMPFLPLAMRPSTPAGWRDIGSRLRAIAATLGRSNLRLAYHNHDFEFLRYGSQTALEWVFEGSDEVELGWEADLGWITRAGAQADAWLDRLGDRLAAVHVKDVAAAAGGDEDGWVALGDGTIRWDQVLPHIASLTRLVIFEHDHPTDHERTLTRSRALLRKYLG